MLCVWWDQCGVVYYELLKPGQTLNTDRYRQQMINLYHALIEKRPEWAQRHGKVILQHENAPSHTAKLLKCMYVCMYVTHLGCTAAPQLWLSIQPRVNSNYHTNRQ